MSTTVTPNPLHEASDKAPAAPKPTIKADVESARKEEPLPLPEEIFPGFRYSKPRLQGCKPCLQREGLLLLQGAGLLSYGAGNCSLSECSLCSPETALPSLCRVCVWGVDVL